MLTDALHNAGLFGKASMFVGAVPLAMGIYYAISPNEQRLALMRPLSLAAIFAALSGTGLGILNVFQHMARSEPPTFARVEALGLAESLVPLFLGFGCLTLAWICVALGMWRRP